VEVIILVSTRAGYYDLAP